MAVKHGMRHTRLYLIWADIKKRCLNKNCKLYSHYGARGITICDRWRDDFATFAADVGPDLGPNFQLGRIDNDRGYEPSNVRWETRTQNMRNRRSTRWVNMDGQKISLAEACERIGVPYGRIHERLRSGWSIDEALYGRS